MVVGLITTDVVSSILDQGVQHYVIKFVSDLVGLVQSGSHHQFIATQPVLAMI
jgi:hypothetical protein